MAEPASQALEGRRETTSLARSGLIAFAGSVVNGIAAFLVIVAITGALDKQRSGQVFTAIAMFNIVFAVSALGADVGLVRFTAQNRGSAKALLRTAAAPALVTSCAIAAAIALARGQIAAWLTEDNPEELARILLAMMPFIPLATLASVLLASTRGMGTMAPTALADRIAKPLSQLGMVVIVSAFGAGAAVVGLAWSLSFAVAFAVALAWFWRLAGRTQSDSPSSSDGGSEVTASQYWEFTVPQAATNVLYVLLRWADILIVATLAGPGPVAVYTAVSRLLIAGNFVNGAIVQAVSPLVSEALGRSDRDEAAHLLKTGTAWLVAVVWPGYIVLALIGEPFLAQLFGPEYTTGAAALTILSLAMMVASGSGPIEAVLLMDGGSRQSLIDNLAAVTTMLTLDALLVPTMGVKGAAIGWAAGLAITNLVPMAQVQRRIGINPLGRAHSTAAAIGLVCVGIPALVLRVSGVTSFALVLLVAATSYAIHLLVLSRFSGLLRLDELVSALKPRGKRRG